MELAKIAQKLNITPAPCQLQPYIKESYDFSVCDLSHLDEIDEKFNVFGKCRDKMNECAALVRGKPHLHTYGNAATLYINEHNLKKAQALPIPEFNDDTPLRFFPLLIYAALLPKTIADYQRRGFSDEEIRKIISASGSGRVARAEVRCGKQGLDLKGYRWLLNYVKGTIYSAGIFGVTPHTYSGHAIVLKNKSTGKYALVLAGGRYNLSGMAIGSAGCEDERGVFTPEFKETDTSYLACPTVSSKASPKVVEYKKSEWEIFLKNGDGVAGIHIPTGTKLTPENIEEGFKAVLARTRFAFPELNVKCIDCTSWLLDPTLARILDESSKIVGFQNRFLKYPTVSDGKSIFGHVFPNIFDSYQDLPEDTSLRRKLKEMYVNGKYIYDFSGFVLE